MTFENERSNKERKWKSQSIFSSLRELQSRRLSKLFTHDWIRSQFRQEQLYKDWVVSCNKEIFTQIRHRVFYLYYCKSNDSKRNEKCRQANREARDSKNLSSKRVKMSSRQNKETSQSRSTLNIEVSSSRIQNRCQCLTLQILLLILDFFHSIFFNLNNITT